MHLAQTLKRAAAVSGVAMLATFTLGLTPTPATAGTYLPGAYIDVDGYGAAVGYAYGSAPSYTAVLTASGGGTCTLANGTATIADFGQHKGKPARPRTDGAVCHLYNATVDYTMTVTPIVGGSSTIYRTCVWELGNQICTVRGVDFI